MAIKVLSASAMGMGMYFLAKFIAGENIKISRKAIYLDLYQVEEKISFHLKIK
ncbi:MAG: hypothetical protein Q7U04_00895 [Bacteriovorax sp.]|nr:hypothetical protein [Bacteriovorax sp.]